jgi:hypothetical protein
MGALLDRWGPKNVTPSAIKEYGEMDNQFVVQLLCMAEQACVGLPVKSYGGKTTDRCIANSHIDEVHTFGFPISRHVTAKLTTKEKLTNQPTNQTKSANQSNQNQTKQRNNQLNNSTELTTTR